MDLTHPCSSTSFYFRASLWKIVMKYEIAMFFNFCVFLKMYIFEVVIFYLDQCLFNQPNIFSCSMYLEESCLFLAIFAIITEKCIFFFMAILSKNKNPFIKSFRLSIKTILGKNGIR